MKVAITEEQYRELVTNPDQAHKAIDAAVAKAEETRVNTKFGIRAVDDLKVQTLTVFEDQMKRMMADIQAFLERDL